MTFNGITNSSDLNCKKYSLAKDTKAQSEVAFQKKKIDGDLMLLDQHASASNNVEKSAKNYDQLELSSQVNEVVSTSGVSEAQKIENRKKIDFADGLVCYTETNGEKYFTLPDGTNIPADQVSSKVDPSEVKKVTVTDNKLVLEKGQYYSITNQQGEDVLLSVGSSISLNSFAETQINKTEVQGFETFSIFSDLVQSKSPLGVYQSYSRKDVSDLLKSIGFEAGKIDLKINNSYETSYYFTHNGELYGESEIENRIQTINRENQFDYGVPAGSMYIIDGKKYELDENGYFNLPSGIMYCDEEAKLIDKNGNKISRKIPEFVTKNSDTE